VSLAWPTDADGGERPPIAPGAIDRSLACSAVAGASAPPGVLALSCGDGRLTAACEISPCMVATPVQVTVGGLTSEIILPVDIMVNESRAERCEDANPGWRGNISLLCAEGSIVPNVVRCYEVVEISLQSEMTFALPDLGDASVDDVKEAMETPEAKNAFKKSLSSSLGVPKEKLMILNVHVYFSRRRLDPTGRRLEGEMSVSLEYQVTLEATSQEELSAQQSTMSDQMVAVGDAESSANQNFVTSIGPNLAAAAEESAQADGGAAVSSLGLLSTVGTTIATEGITVLAVTTPVAIAISGGNSTTASPSPTIQAAAIDAEIDGDALKWVNALAAVVGLLVGMACIGLVLGFVRRKNRGIEREPFAKVGPSPSDRRQNEEMPIAPAGPSPAWPDGQPPQFAFAASGSHLTSEKMRSPGSASADGLQMEDVDHDAVLPLEPQVEVWEVIYGGPLRVRASNTRKSEHLSMKGPGTLVRATLCPGGDWVQLVDEPGFMLISADGVPLLKRMPNISPRDVPDTSTVVRQMSMFSRASNARPTLKPNAFADVVPDPDSRTLPGRMNSSASIRVTQTDRTTITTAPVAQPNS